MLRRILPRIEMRKAAYAMARVTLIEWRKKSNESVFSNRVRHYAEILNPLFDTALFMTSDKLFEFVCVLVRPAGIQGPEWDPWYESQAMLGDLSNLAELDLPSALFHEPARTRVRLSLLSYCHVTEMDLPYVLVVNLLRVRLGKKYDISPFRDLAELSYPAKQFWRTGWRAYELGSPGRLSTKLPAVGSGD